MSKLQHKMYIFFVFHNIFENPTLFCISISIMKLLNPKTQNNFCSSQIIVGGLQTVIKSYWVDNWDLMHCLMVSDDILCWMMFIILQNTFLKLWISYIFNGLFVWYHQWSWAWSQAMAQPSRGTSWGRKMTNDLTTSYVTRTPWW